jgi:hypothetical protein
MLWSIIDILAWAFPITPESPDALTVTDTLINAKLQRQAS